MWSTWLLSYKDESNECNTKKVFFITLECDDDQQCTSSSTNVAFKCQNGLCVLGKNHFFDKRYIFYDRIKFEKSICL